jgi:Zn-dependent protease with chaperone function
MRAVRKHLQSVAVFFGCCASLAQAAILATDLEARVGANYQPADAYERAIWQNLARVEEGIRASPQRLIAPELDAFILTVIERLLGRPAPELRVYVMRDAAFNAAMLPSGMMIVNTGILARVRDEAQLAAVLAHEAGHYFRNHSLDLHREDRRRSALASAVAPALQHYSDNFGGMGLINQAILLSGFRYSRDLESEADAYGLMLMARAGYRPRAAYEIWEQFDQERQAGAVARRQRYRDQTSSELSTHPPTRSRMTNLGDTADHLAARLEPQVGSRDGGWAAVVRPHQAMLLREQIFLNDPGASLYLLDGHAKGGWTGLLRFYEGEIYRLRNAKGDGLRAATAYAAATTLADAPPEAWLAHGHAMLKAGDAPGAHGAMHRYLSLRPGAPDADIVRLALGRRADDLELAAGGHLSVESGANWKRLRANPDEAPWKEMWTWSGPQIDRVAWLDGLPDGRRMNVRAQPADQRVPAFHADMQAHDLTSMLEVSYRLKGVSVFNVESVETVGFLGGIGIKLRYNYASGIVFPKRGSCVMRVVGERLYAMKLEGVANPSFDAVAAEFDRLIADARLR